MMAEFVNYSNSYDQLDLSRDIAVNSYYQWPLSIFYFQFLADIFPFGVYHAILIVFIFITLGISGDLYILWSSQINNQSVSGNPVFWGIAIFFCSLYWFINWQTVPYTFALVLFIPLLSLLNDQTTPGRILLFLYFLALIETHALLGVWIILIAAIWFTMNYFRSNGAIGNISIASILLMILVLASQVVIKNTRFFSYVVLSLEGLFSQISLLATSNRALTLHAQQGITNVPLDSTGLVLKTFAWISIVISVIVLLIGSINVVSRGRVKNREISFILAGAIYFIIGTQVENLGIRSVMLIALAPAFFLVETLRTRHNTSRIALILCVLGIVLFPSALLRSHQYPANYIIPADLLVKEYISSIDRKVESELLLLREPSKPHDLDENFHPITRTTIRDNPDWRCSGNLLVVESAQLHSDLSGISQDLSTELYLSKLQSAQLYDNGLVTVRYFQDCDDLDVLD